MIWKIAQHELSALHRDGRLRLAALFVASLFIVLAVSGWHAYRADRAARLHFVEQARLQWENQGARHPHRAASFGQYVAKPELPLALFDPGIKPTTGQALWLEAHKRSSFKFAPDEDAGVSGVLGLNSAAEAVQTLGALLVVLLGYASIARERESGTLRLILAQGVAPWRWFAGKIVGLGLALVLLLTPLGAALVILFATVDRAAFDIDVATRAGMLLAGYGVYLAIWLALALAISSRLPSARSALGTLLAVWVGATIVAPRLASTAASTFADVPSLTEFSAEYSRDFNNGFDGLPGWDAQLKALEQQALKTHGVASLDQLPVGFSGMRMHAMDEWGNVVSDRHQQRLETIYTQQTRWHLAAALFGPVVPMRALSQGLAGTDWSHYQHFSEAAEQYRRGVVLSLDHQLEQALTGNRWEISFDREVWAAVPRFTYQVPNWHWGLRHIVVPAAMLLAWLFLAIGAVWLGARRFVQP